MMDTNLFTAWSHLSLQDHHFSPILAQAMENVNASLLQGLAVSVALVFLQIGYRDSPHPKSCHIIVINFSCLDPGGKTTRELAKSEPGC